MACFGANGFHESFELRCISCFFAEIDDIDGDVVLLHFTCKSDESLSGIFNRGSDEHDNTLFL